MKTITCTVLLCSVLTLAGCDTTGQRIAQLEQTVDHVEGFVEELETEASLLPDSDPVKLELQETIAKLDQFVLEGREVLDQVKPLTDPDQSGTEVGLGVVELVATLFGLGGVATTAGVLKRTARNKRDLIKTLESGFTQVDEPTLAKLPPEFAEAIRKIPAS